MVLGRQKRKAAIDANNKLVTNNKNARPDEDLESPQEVRSEQDALITVLPDVNDTTRQFSHQSSAEGKLDELEPVTSVTQTQLARENTDNLEDQQREAENIRVDSGIKLTNLI